MFGQVPDLELIGTVENGEGVIDAVESLRPQVDHNACGFRESGRHLRGQAESPRPVRTYIR